MWQHLLLIPVDDHLLFLIVDVNFVPVFIIDYHCLVYQPLMMRVVRICGEDFNNMLESILDAIEQKGGGKEIQIDIW